MRITEVHVHPVRPDNGLVAFASVVVEDSLRLDFIAVHKKLHSEGYRLTFPTKTIRNRPSPVFNPIRHPFYQAIEQAVIEKLKTVNEEDRAGHHRAYA
jgi:DNA-binding cell septation regulator SpoVG